MSPMYVHRISNEMREYHDLQNKDHDLVVSDPTRMRFLQAVIQESLLERFVVAIVEAFNPVQTTLTKTMRKRVSDEKLKAAFNRFL